MAKSLVSCFFDSRCSYTILTVISYPDTFQVMCCVRRRSWNVFLDHHLLTTQKALHSFYLPTLDRYNAEVTANDMLM